MNLRNNRGLTIVELVLAMSFSIVVIVILFAALRLGYKSQEKGASKAETLQKARIISDRTAWLIRGIYPFSVRKPSVNKIFFEGKSDRVGFVTTSNENYGTGPEDRAGLKWVTIHAQRRKDLYSRP
ncbi:MAG: hypothetical protein HZB33_06645 [Nitrospirae bacterium]|nr:hypothetical protein [Nitrospirota bacterium]